MSLVTRSHNRNSVTPFDGWGNDFDTFVSRVFGPQAVPAAGFPVDVYEDVDHLHVDAELPGFTREQIDVTIDRRVLTITAARQTSDEQPKATEAAGESTERARPAYYLRERTTTRVARSFTLPDTIDDSAVDAKLVDGVLHVTLNKRQEIKPRKIAIG